MPYSRMILPSYDPACRRVFYADRLGAESHRITMEIWNRATGRELKGRRLVVYRCKRCAGFHVALKYVAPVRSRPVPVAEVAECLEPVYA